MGLVNYFDMKNRLTSFLGLLLVSLFIVAQLSSCKDEYISDSHELQFSTDTIAFDTIFSEVLTPTQIIKVYNFTDENILIESISLLSEYQCFQINVNGMSGKYFDNQEIKSGDSLFIFAQAFPAKTGENLPLQIEGKIEFKYNNNVQQIVMSAFGQDVNWCKKLIINQNTTWDNTKPYLIYDSLTVEEGVTLEVLEGTYIYMHHDATIVVKGNIKAKGSFANPITIRGDRKDIVADDILYDQLSNQWGGIFIKSTSTDNQFSNVNIRNGKYGFVVDSAEIVPSQRRLIIGNCHIHNMQQQALQATNANIYAYNSLFTNGGNGCVVLQGGEYLFNHCTIAGYQKGAGIYNNALTISDKVLFYDGPILPITLATFNNCIVYGSSKEELQLLYTNDKESLNFFFDHTLIKAENINEEFISEKYFKESYISEDELFVLIDSENRLFDFHLNEKDVARKQGDINILAHYPECLTDKDGNSRSLDSIPDLGAFQFKISTDSTATE